LESHADIGIGTEQSFRFETMMARKAGLLQGMTAQIPPLGMREASFCRMDPRHAFRQQAILSTRFSSPGNSGMIAGQEKRTASVPALTGPSGRVLRCFNAAI
jgi:hypothetical protein